MPRGSMTMPRTASCPFSGCAPVYSPLAEGSIFAGRRWIFAWSVTVEGYLAGRSGRCPRWPTDTYPKRLRNGCLGPRLISGRGDALVCRNFLHGFSVANKGRGSGAGVRLQVTERRYAARSALSPP